MKRAKKYVLWFTLAPLVAFALLGAYVHLYQRYKYPHGWSHCCIKYMSSALESYAEDHDGAYPAGEATPEASLSLLYRFQYADPNALRGKTVPEEIAKKILESGGFLGPIPVDGITLRV